MSAVEQVVPVDGRWAVLLRHRRWTWFRLAAVCCLAAIVIGGTGHLVVRAAGTAIDEPSLNESSGIAASQLNPGILWSHNDSGRAAELYAFTDAGQAVATLVLPDVQIADWEDMAIGPSAEGQPFSAIYVGDIGDNGDSRETVAILRVAEPDLRGVPPGDPVTLTASSVERFDLIYDDGPRDAETLMVDPRDGSVFIAAKTTDETAGLYRAQLSNAGDPVTLEHVGDAAIPGLLGLTRLITGGAISPTADRVVLRTYLAAWWWTMMPDQSIADAMTAVPRRIALPIMRQGEAITFSADGDTLYVTSEGSPALLGSVPAPIAG